MSAKEPDIELLLIYISNYVYVTPEEIILARNYAAINMDHPKFKEVMDDFFTRGPEYFETLLAKIRNITN